MPNITHNPTPLTDWILTSRPVEGLRFEKKDQYVIALNDAGEVATIRSNKSFISFTVIWKPEAYKPLLTKIAEYENLFPGTRNDVRCTFMAEQLGGNLVSMNVLRMASSKPPVIYGLPKFSEWIILIPEVPGYHIRTEDEGYVVVYQGVDPVAEVVVESLTIFDAKASATLLDLVTEYEESFNVTLDVACKFASK